MKKNLCDPYTDTEIAAAATTNAGLSAGQLPVDPLTDYKCKRIRCIARREFEPTDSNDVPFTTAEGESTANTGNLDYFKIKAGGAKLYINMQDVDDAYKVYLTNYQDITLWVDDGAISQYFVSGAALVGAFMLQSLF